MEWAIIECHMFLLMYIPEAKNQTGQYVGY